MSLLNRFTFICLITFVAGCATSIEREVDRKSAEAKTAPMDMPIKAETSGDGLQGLIDKAARQIDSGDVNAGLATLERALRIAPGDASIYLSMAMVYHGLGEMSLAANMARRGLMYCERRQLCKQLKSLADQ